MPTVAIHEHESTNNCADLSHRRKMMIPIIQLYDSERKSTKIRIGNGKFHRIFYIAQLENDIFNFLYRFFEIRIIFHLLL